MGWTGGRWIGEASAGSREASALDWQGIGAPSGKAPARDRRAAAIGPRGERGGATLQPAIRVEISVEPERGPKKKNLSVFKNFFASRTAREH